MILVDLWFWIRVSLLAGVTTFIQYCFMRESSEYIFLIFQCDSPNILMYLLGIGLYCVGFYFMCRKYMDARKCELLYMSKLQMLGYIIVTIAGNAWVVCVVYVVMAFKTYLLISPWWTAFISLLLAPVASLVVMVREYQKP